MNGDGLVNTRTELVEGLCDFGERVQVGMQNFAVHQLGKSINLLVEVLQLFTRCQTVTANSLKAHNEALVVNARNRLCNTEMVVHGATDDLEAVCAGKARQCVQFLGLFQGDVGHVVEARVKPRQFDLRQFVQADQWYLCHRLSCSFNRSRSGFGRAYGNFVVQTDNGVLDFFFCGKVVFHSQLDIGFKLGRVSQFGFCRVDFILLLQVAQCLFGFFVFLDKQTLAAGFFAVADVLGFAGQKCILIGMAELFAHLFAVLVFLVHVVTDDRQKSGEG